MTDTQGLLLFVRVIDASVQDRDAAEPVLACAKAKYPAIERVFVDSGYAGKQCEHWQRALKVTASISQASAGRNAWHHSAWPTPTPVAAFEIQRTRWVVERSHAWTSRPRRMTKDFDVRLDVSEAWIWFVHMILLAKRVAFM